MIAGRWLCVKVIGKTEQGSVSGLVGGVFTGRESVHFPVLGRSGVLPEG